MLCLGGTGGYTCLLLLFEGITLCMTRTTCLILRRSITLSSLRVPSGKKRIIEKRSRTLSSLQTYSTRVLFPTRIGPTIGSTAKSGVALGRSKKFRTCCLSIWRPNMQLSKIKYAR